MRHLYALSLQDGISSVFPIAALDLVLKKIQPQEYIVRKTCLTKGLLLFSNYYVFMQEALKQIKYDDLIGSPM